ncbi:MAG: hypothetical protein AB2693_27810 [Candidatus Thiodiazotropha sp.]
MPRNSVVRLTDHPDMTVAVEWDVKQQNNNNLSAGEDICSKYVHLRKLSSKYNHSGMKSLIYRAPAKVGFRGLF